MFKIFNWAGIIVGVLSFIIIGVFHPIVIKCEYYFSWKVWPVFLVAGLIFCAISLKISNDIISTLCGFLGFVCFWSIIELKHQDERVKKGWFPKNPNRVL